MGQLIITETTVTPTGPHSFCVEASSLQLPPGQWPERIETSLGNKQPFFLQAEPTEEGARYLQLNGCITLRVFND